MTVSDWEEFARINPDPACRRCGSPDNPTVDHVVSRWQGGTDDLSNLQWLCGPCNSRKGPRDDPYWRQEFYFDGMPNRSAMRVAQRQDAFDKILMFGDWFARPFSQISRSLYTLAWIVGAGKTLAIPTLAFALNHVIRRDLGLAHPRVDKVLVLCKEQAIRDQIAADLARDVTEKGIHTLAPRVGVLANSSQLREPNFIGKFDVIVSCIHMFFEKDGQPRRRMAEELALFPMIAIDEPHFALDQVIRIVREATSSLCFGFTGTPITATGEQLRQFVLFSLYDYASAIDNDGSVKTIVDLDGQQSVRVFDEVDIEEAVIRHGGKEHRVSSTDIHGYKDNARPVITVAESVVRYVYECDKTFLEGNFLAIPSDLRPRDRVLADLVYPIHAMLQMPTIEIGKLAADHLNRMFDGDRDRYPAESGYRAMMVRSAVEHEDGLIDKAERLYPDHPWMQAKLNKGDLTAESARFLVVVGIGREGVDNPLCGVVGIACHVESIQDIVQRAIGRQLRAFIRYVNDQLKVPPDVLDTVRIISHSAFGNRVNVATAIRFVLNMADSLVDIPTMEDLMDEAYRPASPQDKDPSADLDVGEKIDIVARVGRQKLQGRRPSQVDIASVVEPIESPRKRRRAEDWARQVIAHPGFARDALKIVAELKEIPRVNLEKPLIAPTEDILVRFIKAEHPALIDILPTIDDPVVRKILDDVYIKHARRFHLRTIHSSNSLSQIRKRLGGSVLKSLGEHFRGEKKKCYPLAGAAMKSILGIGDAESLNDGGIHDRPENHVILTQPEVAKRMQGWIIQILINEGLCPDLEQVIPSSVRSKARVF